MDFKNNNNVKSLKSIAIAVSIITLFFMGHVSFSVQMSIGVLVIILGLMLFICFLYYHEFGGAIMMLIIVLIGLAGVLGRYFDRMKINDDYLMISIPALCILASIIAYKISLKNGKEEKIKITKKKLIRNVIFFTLAEIFCIYLAYSR